jgi:hypothetical protein
MKTENTKLRAPEASDASVSDRLISFELTGEKMNAKGPVEPTKIVVQETLDELFSERLIPFELTAQKVSADGPGEYTVPFYDSRMHSISFSWKNGESFREIVRSAVLDRVKRLSGPLKGFASAARLRVIGKV